jgi:hypothetical protein
VNTVFVYYMGPAPGAFNVQGNLGAVQVGLGCQGPWPAGTGVFVRCSAAGVAEVRVHLGDGADGATPVPIPVPVLFDGGEGPDRFQAANGPPEPLPAGPGQITLAGGPGDDDLTVPDGLRPSPAFVLFGGDGNDRLAAAATATSDDRLEGGGGNDGLHGGDGDDTLNGGGGDDSIDAGPGRDTVHGEDGADDIHTKDNAVDEVSCGAGDDPAVTADAIDRIASDCEDPLKTRLATGPCAGRVVYDRRGSFRVCVSRANENVSGTISLWTAPGRTSSKKPFHVGRRHFSAREGRRTAVRFRLTRAARRKIARRESVRLRVSVHVRDAKGNRTRLASTFGLGYIRLYRPG